MATKKSTTSKDTTTKKANNTKSSTTKKKTTKVEEVKDEVKTTKKKSTTKKTEDKVETVPTTKKKSTAKKDEVKETTTKKKTTTSKKTTSKKSSTTKKKNDSIEQLALDLTQKVEEKAPTKKTTSKKKEEVKPVEEKKKTTTKKQETKKDETKTTTKKTTTKKKTDEVKKETTKKSPTPSKTTKKATPKKKEVTTDTQVLNVLNDDELHTQINLPVVNTEKTENQDKKNNTLKEYDIKKKKENKLKLFLINICKVLLSFIESLKNFTKEKYNSYRRKKESKKILKERFKNEKQLLKELKQVSKEKDKKEEIIQYKPISEIKDKKERKKAKKREANGYNDELVLLRYRDFKGLRKISVFFINRIRVIAYDMKRFKKKFKYGTFKDKFLILMMLCLILGVVAVIVFCGYIVVNAPEISEKRLYKTNATVLYDKDGVEFARLGTENREKVKYEQLPEVLVDAIVATEDSRFFQHNGMDIARFTKAAIGQVLGHADAGGGSTLTMQVSKNAATSVVASGIQGIIRKFTDVYLAVFVFEQKYTKEQIIEFYVNIPYLGSGSYGVEQASRTYFGKSVSQLTLSEAALIAGLFQAPDAYDPYNHPELAEQRRNTVLNLMHRHGYITEEQRDNAKAIPVESMLVGRSARLSQYISFIDTVVEEVIDRTKTPSNPKGDDPYNVSMKIYTTLDRSRQDVVNDVSNGNSDYKFKNDVAQTAIVVISAKDGSIVAIGGGRNKTTERSLNYATNNRTHPGSTAKPVLDYGPAIEFLNWSTGQTIVDEKYNYSGGGSIRNWDSGYKGVMTIKKALAQSRNIPALFAFQQTTHKDKLTFAENLGWTVETDGNGHVLESCSIGGFDGVTPLEAAAAYATFARGGTYIEPYSFTKVEYTESGDVLEVKPKKIEAMSAETAYMVNMILKYAVTSGSIGAGSVSGTDIAAKTGTSTVGDAIKKQLGIKGNIIGDSWEIAYSPDYAIATWYGYPKITKEYHLTNKEGGDARKKITKYLTKRIFKKNSRFKKPSGVVQAEIEIGTDPLELASEHTPKDLRSKEYFKKGTVPTTVSTRFSKLENPTNVRYSSTDTSVTLSWDPIAVPDAINTEYLTNYFANSPAYKHWKDKMLENRLKYNKKSIGVQGYQIYMTNSLGTQNLGFVTSNTFTANVQFDQATTFTIKSSYSIFKDNQSTGVSVSVQPNSSTPAPDPGTIPSTTKPTTTEKVTFSVSYVGGSCSTVNDFNALGNSGKDKIRVTSNGQTVTNQATINYTCYKNDEEIACNTMNNGQTYTVEFTIVYKGKNRTLPIKLSNSCN